MYAMAQTTTRLQPGINVAAVIVTHNRVELLRHSLEVVANQTYPVKHIVVVDNGADPDVEKLVLEVAGDRAVYTPSRTNLGAWWRFCFWFFDGVGAGGGRGVVRRR